MTHAEEIYKAAITVSKMNAGGIFSRNDIREKLGISPREWLHGYAAIFQGMRADKGAKAPAVPKQFKNFFFRIRYGKYKIKLSANKLKSRRCEE